MRTGQFTDLNMRHYRFERTCDGFKGEPKANKGDWLVWGATVFIAVCGVIAWVIG